MYDDVNFKGTVGAFKQEMLLLLLEDIICTHKKNNGNRYKIYWVLSEGSLGETTDKNCLIQNPDVNSDAAIGTSSKGDQMFPIPPQRFSKTNFHAHLCR